MPSRHVRWLDWPAPSSVKACHTLRAGGVSLPPYDSFNVGDHVGDLKENVLSNRERLAQVIGQDKIHWLTQVHSIDVVQVGHQSETTGIMALSDTAEQSICQQADASFTREMGQVCCVMTADCLPVFFCNQLGTQVAVAHAGWRGLLNGVLQQTLATFAENQSVMAYLGPAIGPQAFEVGDEVRTAFMNQSSGFSKHFIPATSFAATDRKKWMGDLYGIARDMLAEVGVMDVYGGDCCTYTQTSDFFSYRRDGVTGRMANLIWLDNT